KFCLRSIGGQGARFLREIGYFSPKLSFWYHQVVLCKLTAFRCFPLTLSCCLASNSLCTFLSRDIARWFVSVLTSTARLDCSWLCRTAWFGWAAPPKS